jgi:transcriptional regulator with XRE-family HTH domain
MSRLGDLLLLERTRQKLTRKQVARKCGVSENYLKDVEEGRRIIQDDQARRILKTLGTGSQHENEFSLDEIAATVDLGTISPQKNEAIRQVKETKPEKPAPKTSPEEQSGIWLDALSSVLKPVPVMNAGWIQVDRRLLPIQDGKIEGANPDRVAYFKAPDDSMRAFRIEKDDLVLIVPQQLPVDGAIMLVEFGAHRALRKIKIFDKTRILLQSGDREMSADPMSVADIHFVGRAVRVEIAL